MLVAAEGTRYFRPPRRLRGELAAEVSNWDLVTLANSEGPAQEWAATTLDGVVAAADAELANARGCSDCGDTGFYGIADINDPDLLVRLLKRRGENGYEILLDTGEWVPYDPEPIDVEMIDVETAGDLATVVTAGGHGLLRRWCMPLAFLPPSDDRPVLAAGELHGDTETWFYYGILDDADASAVLDVVRVNNTGVQRFVDGDWVEDDLDSDINVTQLDVETVTAALPAHQKCEYCSVPATQRIIHSEGMAYILVCDEHMEKGRKDAAACVPYGDPDPSNIGAVRPITADAPLTVSPDPRAEKLRRYWSTGRGAAKIKWNLPSDWRRCYRQLFKYMGVRAKGYCADLHKRNTGMWPGDRRNRGVRGSALDVGSGALLAVARDTESAPYGVVPHVFREGQVVSFAATHPGSSPVSSLIHTSSNQFEVFRVDVRPVDAQVATGAQGVQVVQDVVDLRPVGNRSTVDEPTGSMSQGGTESAGGYPVAVGPEGSSPLPLAGGQDGVVRLKLRENGGLRSSGGAESAVVPFAHTEPQASGNAVLRVIDLTSHSIYCTHPRCLRASGVLPLSVEGSLLAAVRDGQWTGPIEEGTDMSEALLPDGIYCEASADDAVLRTLLAGGFPVAPPDSWFANPGLEGPTPLMIEDSGQVRGHIATWDSIHIGMAGAVRAPKSRSGYAYFQTGAIKTDTGKLVNIGKLTLAGGHASLQADARSAVKHYDDTNSAVADVSVGEDQYGIWAAGALRPSVTPEQLRTFRASPLSGDWRPINGNLELVAACAVNVPGFPIARARVASGTVQALVAAGAGPLAVIAAAQQTNSAVLVRLDKLEQMVAALTTAETAAEPAADPAVVDPAEPEPEPVIAAEPDVPASPAEEAPKTDDTNTTDEVPQVDGEMLPGTNDVQIAAIRDEIAGVRAAQLRAEVDQLVAAGAPPFTKKKSPGKGEREGIGGYPINSEKDLKNAIQAFGRAKPADRARTKAHIISRAKALGLSNLIPDDWK